MHESTKIAYVVFLGDWGLRLKRLEGKPPSYYICHSTPR